MARSETYLRGDEIRRRLMGEALSNRMDQTTYNNPHMQKFGDVTRETIFGLIWTRGGIDMKTRTLITVVSDTATGRTEELKLHLRFALNQGWTEDELSEAILHLLAYVGAPLVREAMLTAVELFAEVAAET